MSIKNWKIDKTWTLFLDRDGVINERIWDGYVTGVDEFVFHEGVIEAISGLTGFFGLIIVVTNQQGVDKGIMTKRNVLDIHNYMCGEIHQAGGKIDMCYFAPNLKGAEIDIRKPAPAMALMAKKDFPQIDFKKSVMIGDSDTDIEFGRNLGMKTVRILSDEKNTVASDISVNSLEEFLKVLENEN